MSIVPIIRFSGGEISPLLYGRIDLDTYYASCKYIENFLPLQYGAAKRRPGLRFVRECKYSEGAGFNKEMAKKPVRLLPFVYSTEQTYIVELGDKYICVHEVNQPATTGNYLGKVYCITAVDENKDPNPNGGVNAEISPYRLYAADELKDVHYTQSADCLFLVHPKVPPLMLRRELSGNNYVFKLTPVVLNTDKISPQSPTASYNYVPAPNPEVAYEYAQDAKYYYGVTLVDKYGMETKIFPVQNTPIMAPYQLQYDRTVSVTCLLDSSEVEQMKVYRNINGIWCYTGRTKNSFKEGNNNKFLFVDDGTYPPDSSHNPPEYINRFVKNGEYPLTVTFDNQRLVFGGTAKNPNTLFGSYVGNYRNFAKYNTPTSLTPYEYPLNTDQVNEIRWLRSASKLLIGTSGAEWLLTDVKGNTPYDGRRSTQVGSKRIQALGINQNTLFVNRVGRSVMSFSHSYTVNDYQSSDLNIFAEHLTRDRKISEWAYSSIPYSVIWCVCDDGVVLHLVYNPDHEIAAWGRTTTEGAFKSVAGIPSDKEDTAFFVVERDYVTGLDDDGKPITVKKQYIEMLDEDFSGGDITKAYYLDCGKSYYYSEGTDIIGGLEHLNGRRVSVVADGSIYAPKDDDSLIVKNGCIKLDYDVLNAHVGLAYRSELETMEIEGGAQDSGVSQSRTRRVTEIDVRFENTVGGIICVGEHEEIIPFRDSSMPMGTPVKLYEGFKAVKAQKGYMNNPTIKIIQPQPLPMTVTAIYPRISIHGR